MNISKAPASRGQLSFSRDQRSFSEVASGQEEFVVDGGRRCFSVSRASCSAGQGGTRPWSGVDSCVDCLELKSSGCLFSVEAV